MLTAHQCLAFTNGLFLRWKAYYPLVPTLIRLLALQAICWPATHFTLVVFDHVQRPLICWIIIGTTTCVSRGIQIWATSNLVSASSSSLGSSVKSTPLHSTRRWMSSVTFGIGGTGVGSPTKKRFWDWKEVGVRCGLPAAVLYFVTAWALLLRREYERALGLDVVGAVATAPVS